MKKFIKLLIVCFLLSFSFFVNAQDQLGSIKGTINDGSKKVIESASVSLQLAKDGSVIQQVLSDKSGKFEINHIAEGRYVVSVSAVGHEKYSSDTLKMGPSSQLSLNNIVLPNTVTELTAVAVVGKKSFIEQKADKMVVNVDASPSSAGSSAMDILEKSPGVTVDKDGNISLKGKQGVTVMIDDKPTYLNPTQLANYLKSLPSTAIDQLEIMTNPSAKYDAAGNSGIINIKTKKNKVKGFNGSGTLTHTQGVYAKPGGSLNLNYRNGKFNVFMNGGYTHWEGFQNLDINRNYFDPSGKNLTSIFSQHTFMKFNNPSLNLKFGVDYYLSNKTTIGFVARGFKNNENDRSQSTIFLKNPNNLVDSIVYSPSTNNSVWKNKAINLNFRHQFDSLGTELTADADYIRYQSSSNQYFSNITYNPDWLPTDTSILKGDLPSVIDIYSFKSDFVHKFKHDLKFEAGLKSSYVSTDNTANYSNEINGISKVDTSKTNRFLYRENINAAYLNLSRQFKKWSVQAGLRLENTNYSGHQLGNGYTVNKNDSLFKKTYVNLFPTLYISYQANAKNIFSINYGRRIDRPAYEDLNPFLFFLDQYTYQAGNPYLQPQYTQNIELSHSYNSFLTTTLNYSNTRNFFTETFEQSGQATIVRNGNIGKRQNAGASISAQIPVNKWWTAILYTNVNYTKFTGFLYGENINVDGTTLMANLNNQFKLGKGLNGELSGWYRTKGVEGQVILDPMGQASAAISKQVLKDKGSLKLAVRDIFYTGSVKGYINFQQTKASFQNTRDSRQVSLTFTYRFGKPFKAAQPRRTGGASDEQSRVKAGGNN
ncbi:MAG: TonB-dependent receptor [Bacteroidetes bacterium]|nr:TonB-dependent receptor [Bacteroidota bacterium]